MKMTADVDMAMARFGMDAVRRKSTGDGVLTVSF